MLQTVMHVAGAVAHHLVLDFLPAEQRLLDEHLRDRARAADRLRRCARIRRRSARCRRRCRRACTRAARPPAVRCGRARLAPKLRRSRSRSPASARRSRRACCRKSSRSSALRIASSGVPSRRTLYFSSTPASCSATAMLRPVWPPSVGRSAVGPLALDDARDHVDGDRLDVDDVGDVLVGHDRRGVGVDEDGRDAFLPHRLAGLRAGVIELRRLADDDRPGADDQHLVGFVHLTPGPFPGREGELGIRECGRITVAADERARA